MSDPGTGNTGTPLSGNKMTTALLGIVAILLVAIVAMIVITSKGKTATDTTGGGQTLPPGATQGGGMPGVGTSTGAFDEKTATKVAAGMSPEQHVKAYYDAILAKKWDVAFKMQPAASQAKGTVADFQSTQTGYGMKTFKILSAKTQGDSATVEVSQDLGANGTWGATWTFVKSGGNWLVKERKVSML